MKGGAHATKRKGASEETPLRYFYKYTNLLKLLTVKIVIKVVKCLPVTSSNPFLGL
jgi:hypothetical protein